MLEIIVDSHIRIKGLSRPWVLGLSKLCSVKNEAKELAQREHIWGADNLDDLVTLAEYDGETLVLPRGFLNQLKTILIDSDVEHRVFDHTKWVSTEDSKPIPPGLLREDQVEPFHKMFHAPQGRVIMPPGKGKTVIGLSTIFSLDRSALIIVEKKHIAQQWVDRAQEHFNRQLGFIGDNKWRQLPFTVALLQTLWSRREELDKADWWSKWNVLMLDEQHHIPADTFYEIISRFPAWKRIGISATVGKSEAKKKLSELVFGPIIYESKGVEVTPEIHVVKTGFDHEWIRTHKVKGKVIRNNYKEVIAALAEDMRRNSIIVRNILDNKNKCNLVVSDRLAHLYTIGENTFPHMKTYYLTGKESLEDRMDIYRWADQGYCVILSTVANEALDIPRIDRIHLVWPRKNPEAIWQIIGRGTRPHPNKKDCIVYDYVDECEGLYNQYKTRLYDLYKPKGLKVQQIK